MPAAFITGAYERPNRVVLEGLTRGEEGKSRKTCQEMGGGLGGGTASHLKLLRGGKTVRKRTPSRGYQRHGKEKGIREMDCGQLKRRFSVLGDRDVRIRV